MFSRTFASALLLSASTLTIAAECVVREHLFAASGLTQTRVDTAPAITMQVSSPLGSVQTFAARSPPGTAEIESEEMRLNRAIWTAIQHRDTAAFLSLLPQQTAARDDVLSRSYALDNAFRSGATDIVAQILRWTPTALKDRPALLNTQSLDALIGTWRSLDSSRRDNRPVENPPAAQDLLALVKRLLDAGADPNGATPPKLLPLGMLAAMPASPETLEAARLLLARGASVDLLDQNRKGPLAYAAESGNAQMAAVMLAARKPSQQTLDHAFVLAFSGKDEDLTLALLDRGANPNVDAKRFDVSEFHPLQWAALTSRTSGRTRILDALIARHANPNDVRPIWDSPLMLVMHNHRRMRALLDDGANVNYTNSKGESALHVATRIPRTVSKPPTDTRPLNEIEPAIDPETRRKSVALLLDYKADPTLIDSSGATALMQTGPEDADMVALLLARGASLNIDDRALMYYRQYKAPAGAVTWAVLHHNDALAAALLKKDGRLASEDCGVFYYAAMDGAVRTLSQLISLRADYGAATGEGRMTPLVAASYNGKADAVALLLDRKVARANEATSSAIEMMGGHGPPVPIPTGGVTALMAAARGNHVAVMDVLVRHGADLNARDVSGLTALGYARMSHALDAVKFLESRGAR